MRKISLYATAAAVMVTGALALWAASTTYTNASIAPTSRIDPMQIMSGAGNLATEHFADYSLIFN